ncbi:MAG TPA: T9SS type A sorting domain-containing protein [Saprospiraceae bacterium]|nr:T9SS type A sorting domain-containing protein [Saprospiraceae bacterium]HMQ84849.1 T9SS type A sorting domain-containing protein [Saprospiraceae bacterium]
MRLIFYTLFLMLGWSTAAMAQPANDACSDAIAAIMDEETPFTTIDATTDGPAHPNNCTSSGTTPDIVYNDVWFTFTSPITGLVRWSLCDMADFDTKIIVYLPGTACPATDADLYACSEDAGNCINTVTSEVIFDATQGETYLLRIGGYGDGAPGESGSGSFTLEAFIPAVANDLCSTAIALTAGEGIMFSNIDATTDGPDHPDNPCFGFGDITAGADIWYTFTPDFDGFVEWSTCSMTPVDTRMAVYVPGAACPPTDADLLACNDDGPGCSNFTSLVIFPVVSGETYLLRLGGYNSDQGQGTFSLTEIIPPTPPANDACDSAEEVFVMSEEQAVGFEILFEGTTLNGTFDDDTFNFPPCLSNQNGGEFADVWYSFNTLGNAELQIFFNAVTPNSQFYVDFYYACNEQVDTMALPGSCFVSSIENPFVNATITGLPDDDIELLIHVSTRLTSDVPGEFFFQIVGDIFVDAPEVQVEEASLAPNPVSDKLNLKLNLKEAVPLQFNILNMLGETLSVKRTNSAVQGLQSYEFDTAPLSPGVYMLNIKAGAESRTMKFVKE